MSTVSAPESPADEGYLDGLRSGIRRHGRGVKPKPVIPREAASRDIEVAIDYYLRNGAEEAALAFVDAVEHAPRYGRALSRYRIHPLRPRVGSTGSETLAGEGLSVSCVLPGS